MATDKPHRGLDIPPDVQQRTQGLINKAIESQPTKETAEYLKLLDDDGNILHGKELLLQMAYELRQLPSSSTDEASASEYAADMCLTMVRQLWTDVPDELLAPLSNGQSLLVLGYLYGKLTMPTHGRLNKAMEAEIKLLKTKARNAQNGQKSGEHRKQTAAERMQEAKRRYQRYLSVGMDERYIASKVAQDMETTPRSVRNWKRQNWGPALSKRK